MWKTVRRRLIYDQPPWLRLWEEDVALPNGQTIERYVLREEQDVVIVAALTEEEELLVVAQYKHGWGRENWEFPAGYLDRDDPSPLAGMQRELREETGYISSDWRFLGQASRNPNRGQARLHCFLALGCTRAGAASPDDTEELTLHRLPLVALPELLAPERGTSTSTLSCLALAWPWITRKNQL